MTTERMRLYRQHRRRANVPAAVLEDARKADRRNGRTNDLDIEFVKALLAKPCAYCGETELRMTLDRKDNAKGHTRRNVVQACERCNYTRRNMPHAAWLVVSRAMRRARIAGLFGAWTCGIHRREPLAPLPVIVRREAPHGTLGRYKRCGPPRCAACRRAMREWKRGRRKTLGA